MKLKKNGAKGRVICLLDGNLFLSSCFILNYTFLHKYLASTNIQISRKKMDGIILLIFQYC